MTTNANPGVHARARSRRSGATAGLVAAAVYFLALLPLVVMNYDAGLGPGHPDAYATRAGFDQGEYHLPVVDAFAEQWPRPDVSDYASATTPGYHLLLAGVARTISADTRVLRGVSLLIGSALVGVLVGALSRRKGAAFAMTRSLPMACSLYVVSSAAWTLPDNAAWVCVLGVLLPALRATLRVRTLALAGVVLIALVLVRQVHLWAAAPVWLAWWLGDDDASDRLLPDGGDGVMRRVARTALAVAATLPAFAVVAWFLTTWGGMTPPSFDERLSGPNLVVPATILTLVALFGAFFAGDWLAAAWSALRRSPRLWSVVVLGMVAGLVLGVLPHSSYHWEDRISHIWGVVRRVPTLADRSPIIVLGSIAGGVTGALVFVALPRRDAWIMLAAFAGFVASQTVGALAWPRYYEPLVLMLLALACARIERVPGEGLPAPVRALRAARTPMVVALGVAQVAVTVVSLRS